MGENKLKFLTVLEYLVDEIGSDLDDIQTIANHPNVPMQTASSVRSFIASIKNKLDVICE